MLGRGELADEVVATTFVRVLEGRFKATGRFSSFLFSVAHRQCLEQLRRSHTARRFSPWVKPTREQPTPEDTLVRTDRQRRLGAALLELPERHRTVLQLYYGQELPSKDVAEILGCSDQQVRSRLAYARRLLRDQLDKESP